ncbi:hypothetical protein CEXT_476101 [Caerostris extrusa]|uniref:Uncharacterized protein n=1 Tax=Caerostris extrusa TaxID=172846 RepID=A0AAV4N5P3_CAEEX|nr:hypothetical protein CEXT_476101 [Caerostris extrusa]
MRNHAIKTFKQFLCYHCTKAILLFHTRIGDIHHHQYGVSSSSIWCLIIINMVSHHHQYGVSSSSSSLAKQHHGSFSNLCLILSVFSKATYRCCLFKG